MPLLAVVATTTVCYAERLRGAIKRATAVRQQRSRSGSSYEYEEDADGRAGATLADIDTRDCCSNPTVLLHGCCCLLCCGAAVARCEDCGGGGGGGGGDEGREDWLD